MIIINKGIVNLRKFICQNCDTEFIAHQGDYQMTVFEQYGLPDGVPPQDILGSTALKILYKELAVECPVCKRMIKVKYGEEVKI